jgi:hypothetical protein
MLNLLPKDQKKEVRGEYLRRFYIVVLIVFSSIDIFLLVAIFPSYISVKTNENIAENIRTSIKNSPKNKDKEAITQSLKNLEAKLKVVATLPGEKPTDYIDKALELRGRGISIQNISYVKKDANKKEVSIEGSASSRADLIDFSKRIKASSWSNSTDIPISNLASDRNIKFFVTLTATSTPK